MTVSKEKKITEPITMMILRMKKMMMKTRMKKKRISKMTTALTTISNSRSRDIKVQRISYRS